MKFDIGICAYNEEKTIEKLLKTLLTENYKNELGKIYVVCSGCTDNTESIVKKYSEKLLNVILIHEDERSGKPSAINKILSFKLAPSLVFIAADNLPRQGSIDKLIDTFQEENVGGVNGHPLPMKGFKCNEIIWKLHHHYLLADDKSNKLQHLTGEFCAFKPIFSKIPSEIINDDAWIAQKMKKNHYKILYKKDAVSYFKSPTNIFEFINQRTRIAFGHRQIQQRTLIKNLFKEPLYTLKILISALKEINFLDFLKTLFLELFCLLKARFYKKGVMWDKIK